ncbi:MAG: hypothetical protein AB7F32_02130 [Victivallaceae bacterium]
MKLSKLELDLNKKLSITQVVVILLIAMILAGMMFTFANKVSYDRRRLAAVNMRGHLKQLCIYADDYVRTTGSLPSEKTLRAHDRTLRIGPSPELLLRYFPNLKQKNLYLILLTDEKTGLSVASEPF